MNTVLADTSTKVEILLVYLAIFRLTSRIYKSRNSISLFGIYLLHATFDLQK